MSKTELSDYTITLDDDPMVSHLIEAATGLKSIAFSTVQGFQSRAERYDPVAVFVDVNLGIGDSGIDLLPSIRAMWPFCPIIVVTGESGNGALGAALAAGAHDYIRKPIDPQELTARLHVRSSEQAERAGREILRFGDLELHTTMNQLRCGDKTAYLSLSDTRLLLYLLHAKGSMVARPELKRKLWGSVQVSNNALDKRLYELRQALRDLASTVQLRCHYGQGYALTYKEREQTAA